MEIIPADDEAKPQSGKMIRRQVEILQYSGPLPDPKTLESYERIAPGSAEQIIAMAEKNQAHRHGIESKALDAQILHNKEERKKEKLGQWFAFIFAMFVSMLGGFLLYTGHSTEGFTVLISTVATIVASFLFRKSEKTKKISEIVPSENSDDTAAG